MSKGQKGDRKKINNRLLAEQTILHMNLDGSIREVLPLRFGDLVLRDPDIHPRFAMLNGKPLYKVTTMIDSILTIYARYGFGDTLYLYDSLATLIAKINESFYRSELDSNDYVIQDKSNIKTAHLKLRGARMLYDVPYLDKPLSKETSVNFVENNSQGTAPEAYVLSQNYPNPFNPMTTISFNASNASLVTVKVYNVLGQEIKTLMNQELVEEGVHELRFDASALSSGVYFYRLTAKPVDDDGVVSGFTAVKKMLLMK